MLQKVINFFSARFRHLQARTGVPYSVYQAALDRLAQRENEQLLSGLTRQMVVDLYDNWRAGKYATLQLVWEQLEEQDPTLKTVIDSRQGALAEMPWRVTIDSAAVGEDAELQQLAEQQQDYLTRVLNRVDNMEEAILHLGMADFRGYAALEITGSASRRMVWNVIEPWNLSRPVKRGPWLYNPEADDSLTNLEELDMDRVIIREVARPVDLSAMFLIVSAGHAMNSWGAWLDTFGVPSIFLELPPNTSERDARKWDDVASKILAEGRGTIPAGTKIHTVETTQNSSDAFVSRLKDARESILAAALGGTLTVTTEAGSGTLAGNAHTDSLSRLCARTAAGVAAAVNRQFVRSALNAQFPQRPHLVYFDLSYEQEDDRQATATMLATYAQAGYYPDEATASELAGIELHRETAPAAPMFSREPEPQARQATAPVVLSREEGQEPAAQEDGSPLTADELALFRHYATTTDLQPADLAAEYEDALTAALQSGLTGAPNTETA